MSPESLRGFSELKMFIYMQLFYEHRNSYPYRLARTPPLYDRKNVKNPNKLLETSSNKV